jgi:hypothetical protein
MIKKLMLATGFGAGYVLGAKAGTQRYEQIVAKARELAGMPAVQDLTTNLQQTASGVAEAAKTKTNDTITSVNSKVGSGGSTGASGEVVDLTSGTTAGTGSTAAAGSTGPAGGDLPPVGTVPSAPLPGTTAPGYDTGAAPMTGAAASDTV